LVIPDLNRYYCESLVNAQELHNKLTLTPSSSKVSADMSSKPQPQQGKMNSSQSDIAADSLVQYDDDGDVILGVILGAKKDRLTVLNTRAREIDLPRARLYVLPGRLTGAFKSTTERVAALKELANKIDTEAINMNVQELWDVIHEDARLYSVSELSELYLGTDQLYGHAALRLSMIRDRTHFKRDRDLFEPRPAHVVNDLIRAEEAKAKKKAMQESAVAVLEAKIKDPTTTVPAEVRDSIRLIEEVAAYVDHADPARHKEAREFTHLCAERLGLPESLSIEKRAFEIMQKAGIFHEHTNLSFIRHEIPVRHTAEVEDEAKQVSLPAELSDYSAEDREFRIDLTRVFSFTIDDISTQDMDDAISLERTPDGYILGIHITDVTCGVIPGSRIDRSAKRRATSIYCADQTINMISNRLSEEVLSLRAGEVRPCLSVLVDLSEELEIKGSDVRATFIRVAKRYTYDEVDNLLESGDDLLLKVHDIAAACEELRIRNGATRVHKREVVPSFVDGRVVLQEIEEDSPARLLVSEMMVLANRLKAEFAAKHHIPVLFRGQERPEEQNPENREKKGAPEGPAKDFSERRQLKKSSVSFEPVYHAGLGVHAYIQATSPIRRYMDLCHQRQLISFLRTGKPWVDSEQFEQLANEVEVPLQEAGLASRETKRYWLLRYLEQRERNLPIEGTVVRVDLKTPLVELDEVFITASVRFQGRVKLGQRVSLKVNTVDAHGDYLRLES
jgi:exoribonuclease-2